MYTIKKAEFMLCAAWPSQWPDESLPEAVGGSTRANVDIDRMIHSAERRKKQKG